MGWGSGEVLPAVSKSLAVRVNPTATVAVGAACPLLITAVSTLNPARKDAVKVVTTRL